MIFSATTALYVGNTSYTKAYVGETQVWPKIIATITRVNSFSELHSGDTYVLINEDNNLIVGNGLSSLVYSDVSSGGTKIIIPPSNYTEFVFDKTYNYSSSSIYDTTVANIIVNSGKKQVYLNNPTSAGLAYLTTWAWGINDRYLIWLVQKNGSLYPFTMFWQGYVFGLYNSGIADPYVSEFATGTKSGIYGVYKITIIDV